jgi:hypothetical protein
VDPVNISRRRAALLLALGAGSLAAQETRTVSELLARARAGQLGDEVFVCPMDKDVRSHNPGTCPRCGMTLKSGLPDQAEYALQIETLPKRLEAAKPVELRFTVLDPWKHNPVTAFQVVHERLFHLFLISSDLTFFAHQHPQRGDAGLFTYTATFPKAGMYRLLADFYPDGGTPQMLPATLLVPGGAMAKPQLRPNPAPQPGSNIQAVLRTVPERPVAGETTQLHFELKPGDAIEKYLGAWGHLLAGSDDLIDMIHTHPFIADGGPSIQFNIVFPRPRAYRLWAQFQRAGVVNTVQFDVAVGTLA